MASQPAATNEAANLRDRIETSLDTVRPALQMDGGDVEFVAFDADTATVHVRLVGVCGACPISPTTVKHGIERRLKEMVPEVREVRAS
ncbi:MAG: NifU family protein [Gemmatimonadetes bacterium]|nr:NifU family protein [Gemmatimonadota bacterium]